MQSPIFSISLIRELRGSPLTVLVAILLLEQSGQVPVTAQAIKDATGFGDHTITDSLRALERPTCQLVARVTGGWRLSTGFQLPLSLEPQNRELRGFGVPSSSSNRKSNEFTEEEEEQNQNRELRDSDLFQLNYKTALELGIRDPKASELSILRNVTPEYIQAHVDQIRDDGHPLGTAIYRIMHGWSVEINESKTKSKIAKQLTAELIGHKPGCNCSECQLSRAGVPVCPDCHHIYQYCECYLKNSEL